MSANDITLLTYRDVAERLQVSERQVRNLVYRGELATITVGLRNRRIVPSDLAKYVENRQRPVEVDPLPFPSAGLVRNRRKAASS